MNWNSSNGYFEKNGINLNRQAYYACIIAATTKFRNLHKDWCVNRAPFIFQCEREKQKHHESSLKKNDQIFIGWIIQSLFFCVRFLLFWFEFVVSMNTNVFFFISFRFVYLCLFPSALSAVHPYVHGSVA